MTSRFAQWTVDVHDVTTMADFWAEALGYDIEVGDDGDAHLRPKSGSPDHGLSVWLQPTQEPKRGKNRNHPDLVASDGNTEREVRRLLELGATRVNVGQTGREEFVVLADPEGNEFCVLA